MVGISNKTDSWLNIMTMMISVNFFPPPPPYSVFAQRIHTCFLYCIWLNCMWTDSANETKISKVYLSASLTTNSLRWDCSLLHKFYVYQMYLMTSSVFWDMMLCILIEVHWHFGRMLLSSLRWKCFHIICLPQTEVLNSC